jgi:hypothetical protein
LEVPESDRVVLERRIRDRGAPARDVQRARIVLLSAQGLAGPRIAERVGCTEPTVVLWRGRFAEQGLAGLEDRPRKPPPRTTLIDEVRDEILTATLTRPPAEMGELDDETLAFLSAIGRRVHAAQEHERRRRTRTITVLSTLLVLALIAAGRAVWQQQQVSSTQRLVIARGMVAQADRIRDRDPHGALQLGVAIRQFDASPQTQASLLQTLESTSHFRTLRSHTRAIFAVAFASDGRTLATGSGDRTAILWDFSGRDRPRQLGHPLTGHTGPVIGVAFAPDRRTLATSSDDQTVRLWDLRERDRPHQLGQPLTDHTGMVLGVAFAPDGRTLGHRQRRPDRQAVGAAPLRQVYRRQ